MAGSQTTNPLSLVQDKRHLAVFSNQKTHFLASGKLAGFRASVAIRLPVLELSVRVCARVWLLVRVPRFASPDAQADHSANKTRHRKPDIATVTRRRPYTKASAVCILDSDIGAWRLSPARPKRE